MAVNDWVGVAESGWQGLGLWMGQALESLKCRFLSNLLKKRGAWTLHGWLFAIKLACAVPSIQTPAVCSLIAATARRNSGKIKPGYYQGNPNNSRRRPDAPDWFSLTHQYAGNMGIPPNSTSGSAPSRTRLLSTPKSIGGTTGWKRDGWWPNHRLQ